MSNETRQIDDLKVVLDFWDNLRHTFMSGQAVFCRSFQRSKTTLKSCLNCSISTYLMFGVFRPVKKVLNWFWIGAESRTSSAKLGGTHTTGTQFHATPDCRTSNDSWLISCSIWMPRVFINFSASWISSRSPKRHIPYTWKQHY